MRRTMRLGRALLTASLPLVLFASNVFAEDVFTIVTSSSTLTLAVLDTTTLVSSAQSTGAGVTTGSTATAKLSGTVGATIGGIHLGNEPIVVPTSITVMETGSTIDLDNQTGTSSGHPMLLLKPALTGGAGSAPADIGLNLAFKVTDTLTLTASGQASGRGLVGDATSPTILLTGTSFNPSGVSLGITAGTLAYSLSATLTSVSGSASFTNPPYGNSLTSGGKLTTSYDPGVGFLYTLTIPISVFLPDLISTLGADLGTRLTGTIVATFFQSIPEPGSFTLMGLAVLGGLGWAGWARRRRTRG